MSRRSIWEIFLRESYRVFCPHSTDDRGHVAAYKKLHGDVLDNGLSPQAALHELGDPVRVSDRLGKAYRVVEEENRLERGKGTEILIAELSNLQDENAKLHQKLDKTHEILALAKQRAIRYFKIGLTISASSIAIGVATRFGYLDGAKDLLSSLFSHKQSVQAQKSGLPPHLLCDPSTGKSMLDFLYTGHTVTLPLDDKSVSLCLRPPPSIVCNPAKQLRQ